MSYNANYYQGSSHEWADNSQSQYQSSSSSSQPHQAPTPQRQRDAQVSRRELATHACYHCPKTYSFARLLNQHLRGAHSVHRPSSRQCETCGRIFVCLSGLQYHAIDCNPNIRESAACRVCGAIFECWAEKNAHHWDAHVKLDIRPSDTKGGPQQPMSEVEYESLAHHYGFDL
ncbi:hypothetical protein BKA65DRAFT_545475 [Rhexocercosporidium sp. MPI-PUGE-AT-0058]|nr:hypothetical protein BKA65DRAFT_545475 [Rhexocercosporidium sp. MPI-PUGE-AT-0058]